MPVVEGVAVSANTGSTDGNKGVLASLIQKAMADAVSEAYAEGITEPTAVRERMMDARAGVKRFYEEKLTMALDASNPEG